MLQCFSSVVGPNGSGKSNVIDAMLFVFGKKAKQVRTRPIVLSYLVWPNLNSSPADVVKKVKPRLTSIPLFQLRLSKVSELIHNSTNHRNLDTAKVSVYFQEIIDLVSALQ